MSDAAQGPGWWQANDGKWYPPQSAAPPPPSAPPPSAPPSAPPGAAPGSFPTAPGHTPPSGHWAPPPPPGATTAGGSVGLTAAVWICIALAFIASFMPWASVLWITVSGLDGDGVLTAPLMAVAAILFAFGAAHGNSPRRGPIIGALVLSIITLLIYGIDLADVSRIASGAEGELFGAPAVQIEIGLYLGTLAALSASILQIALLTRLNKPTR